MIINLNYSLLSSVMKLVPMNHPETPAVDFTAPDRNLRYDIDHLGNRFYIIGNKTGQDRDLYWTPENATSVQNWQKLIPGKLMKDINAMIVLKTHIALLGVNARAESVLKIVDLKTLQVTEIKREQADGIFDFANNPDPSATTFNFTYRSLTEFPSLRELDLKTMKIRTVKASGKNPIAGDLVTEKRWAISFDGTRVPYHVVYKKGSLKPNGDNPLILQGYGNYGYSLNSAGDVDYTSASYMPYLNHGVVLAFGYPRGGGELGRSWYLGARHLTKKNSFRDFAAIARSLIKNHYTNSNRLATQGMSAAGLLMGNMANHNANLKLFKAIILDAPFVDAINTMSDPTLHLTTQEYGEWGNPVTIAEDYRYMRSYSPYDTVKAEAYPAMLVTSTMDDSQVPYWEPAKYIARIRANKTDSHLQLLHIDRDGSHGGGSGNVGVDDNTLRIAFVLDQIAF